jgi:antitoxin component YwqK of YwqJK toxin-antitoxin module
MHIKIKKMKKLIPLFTIIFFISCSQDMKEVDYSKIVTRNDVAYEINSEEPFSGLMTAYHPNGQLKSKTFFVNGMKDGNYLEYRVNGSLLNTRNYVNGTLIDQTSYHPNENMERYEAFKSSKLISIQLYDENGDDDLIDAELIPIGVFLGNKETEESKYNFGNIFKFMMNLSSLEKTDKPLYLNLIKEDGYIPGRVVFLPPKESSLIQSYEPFTALYLDENLNSIKEGKVKRNSLGPVMFFSDYDDKPLRTCLSRKDCEKIHDRSFYDEEIYLVENIQNFNIIQRDSYYLAGSFKESSIFNIDTKEWMRNINKPISYYESGAIQTEYKFQDAKNIGRTEFYEDGTLQGNYNYIGENNFYKTYTKSGNLESERFLNESENIETHIYKSSGEKQEVIEIDDMRYVKTFHANGQMAEVYSEQGYSRDGSYSAYDSDGNVLLTSNVVNGEISGECLIFDSDGQQLARWFFIKGKTNDDSYQNSYNYLTCQYDGIYDLDEELYKNFKRFSW